MIIRNARSPIGPRSRNGGFSMIEVLITIVVMGIGLLGFALLQTMNLRFAQSANYRTQATNLATDMLDQMRSNRRFAVQYEAATFAGGAPAVCTRTVGALTIAANVTRWQCQVRTALGADSGANVTFNPANGLATVVLTWGDSRWNDANNDGAVSAAESNTQFTVTTRL